MRRLSVSTASSRESALERCPNCKTINAPCANYCSTCGRSFTGDREDVQKAMGKDVLENPELVRRLLSGLIEEKRKGEL